MKALRWAFGSKKAQKEDEKQQKQPEKPSLIQSFNESNDLSDNNLNNRAQSTFYQNQKDKAYETNEKNLDWDVDQGYSRKTNMKTIVASKDLDFVAQETKKTITVHDQEEEDRIKKDLMRRFMNHQFYTCGNLLISATTSNDLANEVAFVVKGSIGTKSENYFSELKNELQSKRGSFTESIFKYFTQISKEEVLKLDLNAFIFMRSDLQDYLNFEQDVHIVEKEKLEQSKIEQARKMYFDKEFQPQEDTREILKSLSSKQNYEMLIEKDSLIDNPADIFQPLNKLQETNPLQQEEKTALDFIKEYEAQKALNKQSTLNAPMFKNKPFLKKGNAELMEEKVGDSFDLGSNKLIDDDKSNDMFMSVDKHFEQTEEKSNEFILEKEDLDEEDFLINDPGYKTSDKYKAYTEFIKAGFFLPKYESPAITKNIFEKITQSEFFGLTQKQVMKIDVSLVSFRIPSPWEEIQKICYILNQKVFPYFHSPDSEFCKKTIVFLDPKNVFKIYKDKKRSLDIDERINNLQAKISKKVQKLREENKEFSKQLSINEDYIERLESKNEKVKAHLSGNEVKKLVSLIKDKNTKVDDLIATIYNIDQVSFKSFVNELHGLRQQENVKLVMSKIFKKGSTTKLEDINVIKIYDSIGPREFLKLLKDFKNFSLSTEVENQLKIVIDKINDKLKKESEALSRDISSEENLEIKNELLAKIDTVKSFADLDVLRFAYQEAKKKETLRISANNKILVGCIGELERILDPTPKVSLDTKQQRNINEVRSMVSTASMAQKGGVARLERRARDIPDLPEEFFKDRKL
jgi:hypothetical protein